jgi:mannose-6-phosphate isomerase-like protein (cupin superfamily)
MLNSPILFNAASPEGGIASDDLNATVLSWPEGQGVALHINDHVDVLVVCLSGTGVATVDEETFELETGTALLVPKGSARQISSTSDDFRYLNVHRRKPGIQLGAMRSR